MGLEKLSHEPHNMDAWQALSGAELQTNIDETDIPLSLRIVRDKMDKVGNGWMALLWIEDYCNNGEEALRKIPSPFSIEYQQLTTVQQQQPIAEQQVLQLDWAAPIDPAADTLPY